MSTEYLYGKDIGIRRTLEYESKLNQILSDLGLVYIYVSNM